MASSSGMHNSHKRLFRIDTVIFFSHSDPGGHFSLSREQKERLASFKRISELSDSPVLLSSEADPKHIWQSCITDCTVISSLISCLQHSKRFASSVRSTLFLPRLLSLRARLIPQIDSSVHLYCIPVVLQDILSIIRMANM